MKEVLTVLPRPFHLTGAAPATCVRPRNRLKVSPTKWLKFGNLVPRLHPRHHCAGRPSLQFPAVHRRKVRADVF